eukprot:UN14140
MDLLFPEVYRKLSWEHNCSGIIHQSFWELPPAISKSVVQTRAVENNTCIFSVSNSQLIRCTVNENWLCDTKRTVNDNHSDSNR